MLPDKSCVTTDQHGCPTINVRSEHLADFNAFIAWLRQEGHGRDTGILKLRLHQDDRNDEECVGKILTLLKAKFSQQSFDTVKKCNVFAYEPDAQFVFKASLQDDVYEYLKSECTEEERKNFVAKAVCPETYQGNETSCCSQALESGGPNGLRNHCFEVLRESAQFNAVLENKIQQSGRQLKPPGENVPVLYGSGIQVDRRHSFQICKSFSMSRVRTLLDLVKEKHDGLAYPYVYVGTRHSLFPWHIEEAGMWSINYLFQGATKIWFGIAPQYFGLMDKIASGLNISLGHRACRAVLVDHNTIVADPQYFLKYHGIPHTVVLQEPGDFVITFPFGLHSGFNLGGNLAVAGNFGDPEWIPLGIHTPVCSCNHEQIHLNFTEILKKYRPDLLTSYLNCTASISPPGHPLDVLVPSCPTAADSAIATDAIPAVRDSKNNSTGVSTSNSKEKVLKERVVFCPKCNQSFAENKVNRCKKHIEKKHSSESAELCRIVDANYPRWKPKTVIGSTCNICSKFLVGSSTHLKTHMDRYHK